MDCVNSFNLDQSRHLDQLVGLLGTLRRRCENTVVSNRILRTYSKAARPESAGKLYIYNIPEPKPTRDRPLTKVPPLCSPANARFGDILSLYSPILPRCSPVLPHCSLLLPFYFPVLSLSLFLLFSRDCVLISPNESVHSTCFGC